MMRIVTEQRNRKGFLFIKVQLRHWVGEKQDTQTTYLNTCRHCAYEVGELCPCAHEVPSVVDSK